MYKTLTPKGLKRLSQKKKCEYMRLIISGNCKYKGEENFIKGKDK